MYVAAERNWDWIYIYIFPRGEEGPYLKVIMMFWFLQLTLKLEQELINWYCYAVFFLTKKWRTLTTYNWQNWKNILVMLLPWNPCGRSSVSSKFQILEKLKFLWICEILFNFLKNRYFANNCLMKVPILEFFSTHVTYIIVVIFCTARILVNYRFPFQILRFLSQDQIALLKDRFLKKMLLKRACTCRLSPTKLQAQIILRL